MTKEEQKAVEEFTEMNLTKKGLYHYDDMQDAFLIGLFKGEKMQPSLPSNLDEAAEAHRRKVYYGDAEMCQFVREVFKAGAEWMAGQGVTLEGRVCKDEYAAEAPFYYVEMENSDDLPIVGDKVVVQIRKK